MDNVTFRGDWRDADRAQAIEGITLLANALAQITGGTPAFRCLFGEITFEAVAWLPGRYHGYVEKRDWVKFRIGKVTARLVIHELGHLLIFTAPPGNSPADLLSRYGVKTPDGKLVTGPGMGGYKRNAHRYAPRNGCKKDTYPVHQHPRWWRDGNNPVEDFADMLLSWATDNLMDDERGEALRAWMVEYMTGRLEGC